LRPSSCSGGFTPPCGCSSGRNLPRHRKGPSSRHSSADLEGGTCRAQQAAEKLAGAVMISATPFQHHPGARRATPPHLRRGAFCGSPPDSGGVALLAPGWLPEPRRGGFPRQALFPQPLEPGICRPKGRRYDQIRTLPTRGPACIQERLTAQCQPQSDAMFPAICLPSPNPVTIKGGPCF
jgi:hypothetical protein